jgi:toxin ParE1/3/4
MKVVVHEVAARDLDDIFDWISTDNPGAAAGLVRRIRSRITRLSITGLSHVGRPGLIEGTRELVEAPYIISMLSTRQQRRSPCLPLFTERGIARFESS